MSLVTPQHCNCQSIEPMLNYTQSLIECLPRPWASAVKAALVGDAFGVPHEFKNASSCDADWHRSIFRSRSEAKGGGQQLAALRPEGLRLRRVELQMLCRSIPAKNELHMRMPDSYSKTYASVPYGTWSDDGSQILALLDALVKSEGQLCTSTFGTNLLAWLHDARFQAGGVVFDCGGQTRMALEHLQRNKPAPNDETRNGNGSLMRVLPVAALPDTFGLSEREALELAMAQSDLTHPQALSRVCCALYVQLAWLVRDGKHNLRALMPDAAHALTQHKLLNPPETMALHAVLEYGKQNLPTNSGYVVNSLWSALWHVDRSDSLSDTLRNAVSMGNDTDTIACIAAGLALLMYGWDDRSEQWCSQMHWA